jgi:hypothetical protein
MKSEAEAPNGDQPAPAHPEDFRRQPMIHRGHCKLVTALLFECIADWEPSSESSLKSTYLHEIGCDRRRKRKRVVEEEASSGPPPESR